MIDDLRDAAPLLLLVALAGIAIAVLAFVLVGTPAMHADEERDAVQPTDDHMPAADPPREPDVVFTDGTTHHVHVLHKITATAADGSTVCIIDTSEGRFVVTQTIYDSVREGVTYAMTIDLEQIAAVNGVVG